MEEKIIEAQFTKNKLARIVLIAGISLIIFGFILAHTTYSTGEVYSHWFNDVVYYTTLYHSFGSFFFSRMVDKPFDAGFALVIYSGILCILVSLFFVWEMSRCTLTVTNRRVTGKASFGKAVDLPLNQISAVGLGIFSRITVATSSGRIHFWFIENRDEVHAALTDVIGKVQVEAAYNQNNAPTASNADELRKYKDLFDSGVITQEEFDAKKKQLLGL